MAHNISTELAPAAVKTMKLKQHIRELYLRLGHSEDQANYYMHLEAEEYEYMGPSVSNIVRNNTSEAVK